MILNEVKIPQCNNKYSRAYGIGEGDHKDMSWVLRQAGNWTWPRNCQFRTWQGLLCPWVCPSLHPPSWYSFSSFHPSFLFVIFIMFVDSRVCLLLLFFYYVMFINTCSSLLSLTRFLHHMHVFSIINADTETVESYFVLYWLTQDTKYQDWGWEAFQAIEQHCRTPQGYLSFFLHLSFFVSLSLPLFFPFFFFPFPFLMENADTVEWEMWHMCLWSMTTYNKVSSWLRLWNICICYSLPEALSIWMTGCSTRKPTPSKFGRIK